MLHPSVRYCFQGEARLNFGDALPELLAELFVPNSPPVVKADVIRLVGSVIDPKWMEEDLKHGEILSYWGCGMRQGLTLIAKYHCQNFPAVRGPLTRSLLNLHPSTPTGDSGFLLPLIYPRNPFRSSGTIAIPHINELRDWDGIKNSTGVDEVITPWVIGDHENLKLKLIDKISIIAHSEFVLTGSLHGAVIAAAYGVPFAFWNSGYINVPFKWVDFASSLHIPCKFVSNLKEGQEWYEEIKPRMKKIDLRALLASAPFPVKPMYYQKLDILGYW